MTRLRRVAVAFGAGALVLLASAARFVQTGGDEDVPLGDFGLSRIATPDGLRPPADDFFVSSDCALCHPRQWAELEGSMHSVSHTDRFYRRFAELARKEAGEEVYTYCSGCHSPAGVVTGSIPALPEDRLPEIALDGVGCDVCHQVSELTGHDGPWGEPGNASLVLSPGRVKYGPFDDIERNPAHEGEQNVDLSTSEFCASCHTVIHPVNGLRIEHTYDEWRGSIYAEKGIQCQDCHMRSVEDAVRVAETLEPVVRRGTIARKGGEREIALHTFVGGNVHAGELGGGERHSRAARERLRSAARLHLELPENLEVTGSSLSFEVTVENVGAGHALPTSLTELRQMWVHVRVVDAAGTVLMQDGALDDRGHLTAPALRFGSELVDASGAVTHRPWEAVDFAWKRTVPPKGRDGETFEVELGPGIESPLSIEARLLYRIAPPHVVKEVMGPEAFTPEIVEMATASAELDLIR